jgi:hypothetical protein
MPWVGFEPMIAAFERAKTVHVSDRAPTMIGPHDVYCSLNNTNAYHWYKLRTYKILYNFLLYMVNPIFGISSVDSNSLRKWDVSSSLLFKFAVEFVITKVQQKQAGLTMRLNGSHQLLVYVYDNIYYIFLKVEWNWGHLVRRPLFGLLYQSWMIR